MCLIVGALHASMAMAQSVKTPGGPVGPPGGVPGYVPPGGSQGSSVPAPSMPPTTRSPSVTVPPMAPDMRPPAVVAPPPPQPPAQGSRDAGGSEECDCYKTVEGKRVFAGKNATCCPK
jgi:hypothetical protein